MACVAARRVSRPGSGEHAAMDDFFEQSSGYGYALDLTVKTGSFGKPLDGRSARIIVTMGMPDAVDRCFFRAGRRAR
jgi:hypothetical protein